MSNSPVALWTFSRVIPPGTRMIMLSASIIRCLLRSLFDRLLEDIDCVIHYRAPVYLEVSHVN